MQETKKVTTRFGHSMTVYPNDAIGNAIIKNGVYDEHGVEFISNILEAIKARGVLDVGANIGNHSLAFSRNVKELWSFEPNPTAFKLLKMNVENNNVDNITICNFGLSIDDGEATLFVDESGNLGASTLRKESRLDERSYSAQGVTLKNGDKWVRSNIESNIDFIKIDVEGHEEAVIKGLGETIKKHRPIVIMEWSDKSSDKKGMARSEIFDEVFIEYSTYATFINTDRRYWRKKFMGGVRKIIIRALYGKKMVFTPFSIQSVSTSFKARDLLLVPKEKKVIMSSLVR